MNITRLVLTEEPLLTGREWLTGCAIYFIDLTPQVHDLRVLFFFFQAEDGIRDWSVTGVQTCALPIFTLGAHMDIKAIQTFLSTTVVLLGTKIVAAIAFWIIGRWLIGKVVALIQAEIGRASCRERV